MIKKQMVLAVFAVVFMVSSAFGADDPLVKGVGGRSTPLLKDARPS